MQKQSKNWPGVQYPLKDIVITSFDEIELTSLTWQGIPLAIVQSYGKQVSVASIVTHVGVIYGDEKSLNQVIYM